MSSISCADVLRILEDYANQTRDQHKMILGMLKQSEDRINTINPMVSEMIQAVNHLAAFSDDLTTKYVKHLEEVCRDRDTVRNDNARLIEIVARLENELRIERERYNELVKQLIMVARHGKSDTNINVN